MKLWIVGKLIEGLDQANLWEFCGVFDDELQAQEACTTPLHFVGSAVLNWRVPDETTQWPGAYFPKA